MKAERRGQGVGVWGPMGLSRPPSDTLSQPGRDGRRVGEHSPGSAHTEIELPRN